MEYSTSAETMQTTVTVHGDDGKSGQIRLPIGYRFVPTDEELVLHYLLRRALNFPLPASVIPVFNVFQADPWNLPGDLTEKRYFFTDERTYERSTCSGYWKPSGEHEPVVSPTYKQAVGTKRSYNFIQKKFNSWIITPWIMHEYRLVISDHLCQRVQTLLECWTAYCIYQKKMKRAFAIREEGREEEITISNSSSSPLHDQDYEEISSMAYS